MGSTRAVSGLRGGSVRLLFVCAFSLASIIPAPAETLRGVALVIGNSAYEHLGSLANPANDAEAIEDLFEDLGFDVERTTDADAKDLTRDLERFVEDAGGADVAVLYYAGHGIEAGGENFLVPVDADLAALDDADRRLVPISAVITRLQNSATVTIVMLDACRDNPFPRDATLKVTPDAAPLAVSAAGLSLDTRGATSLTSSPASAAKTLGTVIAFAAEPGKVALDGEPGANSPYAAAILRHLSAMAGTEFGTVMRMVANEVYLKTNARQRPWVNESLTRLLYFGEAPQPLAGEEGDILRERQGLLIRIDALPDLERRQVETAALNAGVPMDALFGMLNVLGADAPKDAEQLDAVLRSQTARLKDILAERETLKSADPEIVRLSALADRAIAEGALATALRIHEDAKARVKVLEKTLQQAASELGARFIEAADVYARSAAAYEIAFDYQKAAADYAEAFRLIERWDELLAWRYKNAEALAYNRHGDNIGDRQALEQAIAASRQALAIVSRNKNPHEWAISQDNLGYALRALGIRTSDSALLGEGVAALQAALDVHSRDSDPIRWARAQSDLGLALRDLAILESDPGKLEAAIAASRAAVEELKRERVPQEWAMAQTNLGNALTAKTGRSRPSTEQIELAITAYRAALEELTREAAPLAWSVVQNNLADALSDLGNQNDDIARLKQAEITFRAVLDTPVRDAQPRQWAKAEAGLGNTLLAIGAFGKGVSELTDAVGAYRAALEEYTRQRDPRSWAFVQNNLGLALVNLGYRQTGTARFEEAAAAFRAAIEEYGRGKTPQSSIAVHYLLGNALRNWGLRETGAERLEEAVVAFRAALEQIQASGWRPYFGLTQNSLGDTLFELARRQDSVPKLEEAVAAYRAALADHAKNGPSAQSGGAHRNLGLALLDLGKRTANAATIEEARAAFSAAADIHKSLGQSEFDDYFAGLVRDADAALKALRG